MTARAANNFDALRFCAAASVVFSHAFLMANGTEDGEWFAWLTGGQTILGLVGVFVFFTISGYLVTGSYLSTGSPGRFALKRALRIFPGLWVNLLVVGFVLGGCVTTLGLRGYLTDPGLGLFFRNNLLLQVENTPLPGVTFSSPPMRCASASRSRSASISGCQLMIILPSGFSGTYRYLGRAEDRDAIMQRRKVVSEVAGTVWKIEAPVGSQVEAGAPLLRLEPLADEGEESASEE